MLKKDIKEFRRKYYSKSELICICKNYDLNYEGSKIELVERIAYFLETGEKVYLNRLKRNIPNVI